MSLSDGSTNRHFLDSGRKSLPAVTLRALAVGAVSLGAVSRPPTLAASAIGVGLVLFLWSMRADQSTADNHVFRWSGILVVLIIVTHLAGSFDRVLDFEIARLTWLVLLVIAAALGIGWGHKRIPRYVSIAFAMLAVLTITFVMTVGEWRSDLGLDVYWMHRNAGEALFQGENPYTDAVRVFNGSPFAPDGSVIEGYPYPPVVLATYAATGNQADPRLVSSVVWIGVLAWMAWHARREGSAGDISYAMFLLMAGLAVWPGVWFGSWTEPLSIGLLLLTAVMWRKRPLWSAITLGLAIASKQYFIFLAPLLLLQKGEQRWKRLLVSVGVAAGTVVIGLIPDPNAYLNATVFNLSEIGFRPDSQSLSGLFASYGFDFYLTPLAWLALGLALAVVVSRGAKSAADFVGRGGLILGLAFFFGQAFVNYWFLVAGLFAISALLPGDTEPARGEEGLPATLRHTTESDFSVEPLR